LTECGLRGIFGLHETIILLEKINEIRSNKRRKQTASCL
jgi:hypothetical protein